MPKPEHEVLQVFVQNQKQAEQEKQRAGLRAALKLFPASERQEEIAAALQLIAEEERKRVLLNKAEHLSADELERLLVS